MKLSPESKIPRREYPLSNGTRLLQLQVPAEGYPVEEVNRNVFLIDVEGKVIWRVAYHECVRGDDPFVRLDIAPDGTTTGLTWDGWRFEINVADGSLKKIGWTKS